jgi:CRISPR/Cas system CSM-associated protein Csm3 (group 7 of RAMP superfamily)
VLYQSIPRSLSEPASALKPRVMADEKQKDGRIAEITIQLQPRAYWMFGGGVDPDGADMAPVTDSRVVWNADRATVENEVVYIPGTALKGALAHRVCFHANRRAGRYADMVQDVDGITGSGNDVVRELFGYSKGDDEMKDGLRGRVVIDDMFIRRRDLCARQIVQHVSIDRFTGGARAGALFNEHPLYRGDVIQVRMVIERFTSLGGQAREALRDALMDLCEARLQIGGGSGRGAGFCNGKITKGLDLLNNREQ